MMQHWDVAATMQATTTVNYEQHNNWYNTMFAANIKTELGANSPSDVHGHVHRSTDAATPPAMNSGGMSQLESYLKQQHHNQQQQQQQQPHQPMDTLTPSPSNNNDSMQHFFDSSNNMQQQLLQQQQYQQQFQQAQHAAALNQTTVAGGTHLPLGFNPLTPPGLPSAVLPSMAHFYGAAAAAGVAVNTLRGSQQTPSPQSPAGLAQTPLATPSDVGDKLQQSALTPRNTPPMDITPPKSPKVPATAALKSEAAMSVASTEKDQDLISNSSEDLKYMAESEDDETAMIRQPIYNSHGKMKNYRCKTCGHVAITKVAFWAHTRAHMKPEKVLQCPKCPFVTELKHHLEYHIRKHKNLKPFQCDKCAYTCVNKSMLNSHRKSHSSVYQYRCADCDYATKYCHSFKLHLRKYEHKPGMVLDEEGVPNPAVIIDVYGTRRGPKNKAGASGGNSKRSERLSANALNRQQEHKSVATSQLSAALQGFTLPSAQPQHLQAHQMPASPAKSSSSTNSELPSVASTTTALTINMALQQQAQQHQQQQQLKSEPVKMTTAPAITTPNTSTPANMTNLLPPLASILQQNHHNHMAFFPYWNLNLQMLAAQQQVAALAQLSPSLRETALQQLQQQQNHDYDDDGAEEGDAERENDMEESDRRSIDSAMDLSQGTPTKEEQPTPSAQAVGAINLKLKENGSTHETPLIVSQSSSRRKGRVLKLDTLLQVRADQHLQQQSPASAQKSMPLRPYAASSPMCKMDDSAAAAADDDNNDDVVHGADDSAETEEAVTGTANSSSGNSSNSSNSSSIANTNPTSANSSSDNASPPVAVGAIYECKYCDIYFKDAVLYHIHMGYHSCDDVFRCNMCGEKCDSPVGLFVHMARNAHS